MNYLTQWYPEKASRAEAEAVSVGEGESVTGVDAKLHAGGQITGTVTDVATHLPIEGVQVCAQNVVPAEIAYCGRSGPEGKYAMLRLATGTYTVEFSVERSPNYIRQYYPGKPSFSEAEPVAVSAGATTPNIDAAMREGVQITGQITEAVSGEPIRWIVACALDPVTEAQVGCSLSEPNEVFSEPNEDRYSIAGLPLGSYVVGFSIDRKEDGLVLHPDEYVRQYYNDKPTFAEASSVGGAAGVYPGIDAHHQRPGSLPGSKPLVLHSTTDGNHDRRSEEAKAAQMPQGLREEKGPRQAHLYEGQAPPQEPANLRATAPLHTTPPRSSTAPTHEPL